MDTRNGYIYGVAEASHNENSMTNAWQTSQKVEATRRDTESAAFAKLVDSMEDTWKKIVHEQLPADIDRNDGRRIDEVRRIDGSRRKAGADGRPRMGEADAVIERLDAGLGDRHG